MSHYTQDELEYIARQIARLIVSTEALHERFGTRQNAEQAAARVHEEADEVTAAMRHNDVEHAEAEIVDVWVTAFGLPRAIDSDALHVARRIDEIIAKNDAKTLLTHELRHDGKIARRKRTNSASRA